MIARWTTWLAISLWTISIILCACMLVLELAAGPNSDLSLGAIGFISVVTASMSTVGTLLAIHRTENPLGWIFLTAGLAYSVTLSADHYAYYITAVNPGSLPELTLLFWLGAWAWVLAIFLPAMFGTLLFPTGRLPSRRWRPFAWLVAVALFSWIVADMLSPGPLESNGNYPELTNPIAIESLSGVLEFIAESAELVGFPLFVVSVASIFIRLRVATPVERQQIKWFAYAAVIPVTGFGIFILLLALPGVSKETANFAGEMMVTTGIAILPVTIGIAILRHNLYDIDRLINRTLVYGSLTLLLLIGFAGNIILLQFVLSPFTGGNDLAVAGSTLLVFALFRPLRTRLQSVVDRRFYRSKYNARQTLQTFGLTARDAVDLNQLITELTSTVSSTMQPEHISVWLPPAASREGPP